MMCVRMYTLRNVVVTTQECRECGYIHIIHKLWAACTYIHTSPSMLQKVILAMFFCRHCTSTSLVTRSTSNPAEREGGRKGGGGRGGVGGRGGRRKEEEEEVAAEEGEDMGGGE